MRLFRPAFVYFVILFAAAGLYTWLGYAHGSFLQSLHFSVDTMTLRGRINEDLCGPCGWVLVWSDVQALIAMSIIVAWFGYVFASWAKKS